MAPVMKAVMTVARLTKVKTMLTYEDSLTPKASSSVMMSTMSSEKKSAYAAMYGRLMGTVLLRKVLTCWFARLST